MMSVSFSSKLNNRWELLGNDKKGRAKIYAFTLPVPPNNPWNRTTLTCTSGIGTSHSRNITETVCTPKSVPRCLIVDSGSDVTIPHATKFVKRAEDIVRFCAERGQTDQTSVEIIACKFLANTCINQLKQSVDTRWKALSFRKGR
eukprot:PhF_6_TR897/c0_g3_i7/m.1422